MVAAERSISELLVLVVEDSAIIRERLIRLLSGVPNVRVIGEAKGATEAVQKIAELEPDVVTVDLRLQQGSGLDVLRSLRWITPRPRVAVLTNYGDEHSKRECMSLGADYFFDKSHDLGHLRDTLSDLARAGKPTGPEAAN